MKRFKVMVASLALVVGASGAALAQPWQQNQQKVREEAHRTTNLPAQNYEAVRYGVRDGRGVIADGRRPDGDDVRTNGYGRYTNDELRGRGHDNDDAWQYRAAENDRHRDMGAEVRVPEHGSGHARPRVDRDRDRF
jgi:hypothetical protein